MTTDYIRSCYEKVKKKVIGSLNKKYVGIEKGDANVESFVGFLQLFSNKTTAALTNTALVAHAVHVIPMSVLARIRQHLNDHIYTRVVFLPVCSTDEQLE